jgi:hypothetical protein
VAPSLDSPPDGARVTTPHPTLSVNNATGGEGAILSYAFELYADAALTQPAGGANGVPEGGVRTQWTVAASLSEDQTYYWRARAGDGFSWSAWTSVGSFVVDAVNPPPTSPVPDTPLPGAQVATRQPELTVRNAHDPDGQPLVYDFRLASNPEMTLILSSASGIPEGPGLTTWAQPIVLVEDQTYYWSARASDGTSASPWFEAAAFTVNSENQSPYAPTLLEPIGGVDVPSLTPELRLANAEDPEGDALAYLFQLDRVPSFDSPDLQASPLVPETPFETAWTPPLPLLDDTTYFWRAAASDGTTTSAWAGSHFFVNLANEAPGAPVPLQPGDGSVVGTTTPTLVVQNAVDPDQDALAYDYQVEDEAGVEVASASGVPEGAGQTAWTVDVPLAENATFFWSSRAGDGELLGDWSEAVSFRVNASVDPPTAPGLVAPLEGSVLDVPLPELVVSNASSPDGEALTYTFELYQAVSGGGLVLVESAEGVPEGTGTTSWIPTQELSNGDYAWRSRAVDAGQHPGPWMETAHFTVNVDLPPAPPPSLEVASMRLEVYVDWEPSPDSDVVSYRVYRATVPGGPYALVGEVPGTYLQDTAPQYLLTLYYVVTALDAHHESGPSPEVSITPRACLSNSPEEACPHPLRPRRSGPR